MIDDTLNLLRQHMDEQKYLLDVLALWRHVEKAGYPSDTVKAFTFRPEFLTRSEDRAMRRPRGATLVGDTHFNCVRLKSGGLAQIPLYPRPKHQGAEK